MSPWDNVTSGGHHHRCQHKEAYSKLADAIQQVGLTKHTAHSSCTITNQDVVMKSSHSTCAAHYFANGEAILLVGSSIA